MAFGRPTDKTKPGFPKPASSSKKPSEDDDAADEVAVIGEEDVRHWKPSWAVIRHMLGIG